MAASTVSNLIVDLVGGTDRELLARWTWADKDKHTDHFEVSWQYNVGDGVWISGNESTAKIIEGGLRQSTYTAPNNAFKVRVAVKVVGKDITDGNGKKTGTYYSGAKYCDFVTFPFNNNAIIKPYTFSLPNTLTMELNRHPTEATSVYFNIANSAVDESVKDFVQHSINAAISLERGAVGRNNSYTYAQAFGGYDYEWQYYVYSEDQWFPGNNGNSGTEKVITYQYPAGATHIRLRVKPISNEYTSLADGQSHEFFTCNNFTAWTTVKISDLIEAVPVYSPYDSSKVTFSLETGSSTSVLVRFPAYTYSTWSPPEHKMVDYLVSRIGGYSYVCYYKDVDSGQWINHQSGTTGTTDASRYFTYTPPTGAKKIGIKIRPFSTTYQKYGADNYYWKTSWSEMASVEMKSFDPDIAKKDPIPTSNIVVDLVNGSPNTLYAAWVWNESHTQNYEFEWEYYTGNKGVDDDTNVWFEGSDGEATNKNCTYSIPTGAKYVRFRVKPVSTTHTDGHGRDLSYWTSKFSSWIKQSTTDPKPDNKGSVSKILIWSLPGTERNMYATLVWNEAHTKEAKYVWSYSVVHNGTESWIDQSEQTTTSVGDGVITVPSWSVPVEAKKVRIKATIVSETYTDTYGRELEYWVTSESGWFEFNLDNLDPTTPGKPNIEILQNGYLRVSVDNYNDTTANRVEFQILQDYVNSIASGESVTVALNNGHAELKYAIPGDGHTYTVRARGVKNKQISEWSEWSNAVTTGPAAPKRLISAQAYGATQIKVTWDLVDSADTYTIEYAENQNWFDASDQVKHVDTSSNVSFYLITFSDTDFGKTWYFRVKAVNSSGSSGWTNILSCILARKPSAPTTWSESAVIGLGDTAKLYWVHNAEDKSNETQATISYRLSNDPDNVIEVVINDEVSDDNVSDMIHTYEIDTSSYATGCLIFWSVKTKGASPEYSDPSAERQIGVYSNPTVAFTIGEELTALPVSFTATAEPPQQTAIAWNVKITALEPYDTVDVIGNSVHISEGQVIYSKFMDITGNSIDVSIGAGDVTLENNISYSITVNVGMDSGLSASATHTFTVSLDYSVSEPYAEILLNSNDYSASIRPYCYSTTEDGYDQTVRLSVYRREYDGRFVAIAKNLENTGYTSVIDPHPSLDSARYRIVAMSMVNGHTSYVDVNSDSFNVAGMIIQWGDTWSEYDPELYQDRIDEEPRWNGSLLHLPYNVDISEEVDTDVALIEYIGRDVPVSYYGTQLGIGGTWTSVIPADDFNTLYALRRLAIYRGDVYIRSSSGLGYWAQINVSFEKTNREVTIPVTITVKRVEGGI